MPELVTFGPNRAVFCRSRIDRLTLAVVEPAPFTLALKPPGTELLRGGRIELEVAVERAEGFDGPVTVRRLWLPSGTSSPTTVRVEPGKTSARLRVDAKTDARLGSYEIALLGEADRGGTTFQATSHVPLTVAEPHLTGAVSMAAVGRGGRGEVVATFAPGRPFEGTARARLLNLPAGVTASALDVDAETTRVAFPIEASGKARLGLARNLFVELTVETAGGPVSWRTAHGGQLRVDRTAATAAAPADDEAGPSKSRLELLRDAARRRAEERRAAVAGDPAAGGGGRADGRGAGGSR